MSFRVALGGAAQHAVDRAVPRLVDERIASAVLALDPTLWGPESEAVAARRLGWTEAVANARPVVAEVRALRSRLRQDGVDGVVLVGDPGCALGAAAVARTLGADLTVLQTAEASRLPAERLASAALVVASTSGAAPALDAVLEESRAAFREAGVDPARRIVVVAPAGSSLDTAARRDGFRFFAADPAIGDRFSVLSAPVLVPSGLAGADIGELLDEAESEELNLALDDRANPGFVLAAAIVDAIPAGGTLAIVADGTHVVGLDEWAAHLVSASLHGGGLLAVALAPDAPQLAERRPGLRVVRLVEDAHGDGLDDRRAAGEVLLSGTLGELLLVWQVAVAVAGHLLGVNPFDDVDAGRIAAAARGRLEEATAAHPTSPETATP